MFKKLIKSLLLISVVFGISAGINAQGRVIEIQNPKMRVFLPPGGIANGKAVLALPGGGYSHLAVHHEGFHWAPFFNHQGLAYAVLEYTMPKGDPSVPMADVEAAFKILTDSASQWRIKPDSIGVMGSSAGGHLASAVATHPTAQCRPAFQILFYPVISMDPALAHKGSRQNLLGDNPAKELENNYSSEKQVNATTPRAIMLLSSDDRTVAPSNSLRYYESLINAGVPASLIIYPTGGHGWGARTTFKYHDNVLMELKSWLKNL